MFKTELNCVQYKLPYSTGIVEAKTGSKKNCLGFYAFDTQLEQSLHDCLLMYDQVGWTFTPQQPSVLIPYPPISLTVNERQFAVTRLVTSCHRSFLCGFCFFSWSPISVRFPRRGSPTILRLFNRRSRTPPILLPNAIILAVWPFSPIFYYV